MIRDRCLLTLLLCIPGLILAETWKPDPVDPQVQSQILFDHFWVQKTHAPGQYDMVVLGDSRIYRGISPAAMEEVLHGYQIINLGYSNGSLTPLMFDEAENRINPKSLNRTIVLGVTPVSLTPVAAENEHFLQEKQRSPDYVFTYLYLYPFLYYFQPVTPQVILDALVVPGFEKEDGYFQEFYDDGWAASWMIPEDPAKALESYKVFFSETRVSSDILVELYNQTRRWIEQGIRIYAFRPPVTPEMFELEQEMSGFNQESFIDQFTQAGGVWIDIPLGPYNSYDGSHLVKESAVQLSIDVATKIKQEEAK